MTHGHRNLGFPRDPVPPAVRRRLADRWCAICRLPTLHDGALCVRCARIGGLTHREPHRDGLPSKRAVVGIAVSVLLLSLLAVWWGISR